MSEKISQKVRDLVYLAYPLISNTDLSEYCKCSIPWLEKFAQSQNLKKGNYCNIKGQEGYPLDLTDWKFGKLIVKQVCSYKSKNNIMWLCQCECGNNLRCRSSILRKGLQKSCYDCLNINPESKTQINKIASWAWSRIKAHARERGISINVTLDYIVNLFNKQNGKCALSGIPISIPRLKTKNKYRTASLDRIDSTKGYEEGNLQWVHKNINQMKNKHTDKEFIEFCHLVSDYQRQKD